MRYVTSVPDFQGIIAAPIKDWYSIRKTILRVPLTKTLIEYKHLNLKSINFEVCVLIVADIKYFVKLIASINIKDTIKSEHIEHLKKEIWNTLPHDHRYMVGWRQWKYTLEL